MKQLLYFLPVIIALHTTMCVGNSTNTRSEENERLANFFADGAGTITTWRDTAKYDTLLNPPSLSISNGGYGLCLSDSIELVLEPGLRMRWEGRKLIVYKPTEHDGNVKITKGITIKPEESVGVTIEPNSDSLITIEWQNVGDRYFVFNNQTGTTYALVNRYGYHEVNFVGRKNDIGGQLYQGAYWLTIPKLDPKDTIQKCTLVADLEQQKGVINLVAPCDCDLAYYIGWTSVKYEFYKDCPPTKQ